MEISISNFRCYYKNNPTVYTFQKGLCHLVGESGAGKSTVIMAIKWCLYGENTGIKPRGKSSLVPEVIIRFENFFRSQSSADPDRLDYQDPEYDLTIERRSPNFINVFLPNDVSLDSDAAQGWINKTFGSKDLWLATSCLFQGTRNVILSGTGEEKFRILRELTYGSDVGDYNDPDWYLGILKERFRELDKEHSTMSSKYNAFYDYLDPLFDDMEKNNDWNPDKESIVKIQSQIRELNKQKSKSVSAWAEYENSKKQLTKLEASLAKIPKDLEQQLQKHLDERTHYQEEIVLRDNYTALKKIQDRLRKALIVNNVVQKYKLDPKRLAELTKKESLYQNYVDICAKKALPLVPEVQDSWIIELQTLVNYNDRLIEWQKYQKSNQERLILEKKLHAVKDSLAEGFTTDSDELDTMMGNMTQEKHELHSKLMSLKTKFECRSCKAVNIVSSSSKTPISPEEEAAAKERLEFVTAVLDELPQHIATINNIKSLESRLKTLKESSDIVKPVIPAVTYVEVPGQKNPQATLQSLLSLKDQCVESLTSEETREITELRRGADISDLLNNSDVNIDEILQREFKDPNTEWHGIESDLRIADNRIKQTQELIAQRNTLSKQIADYTLDPPKESSPDDYDDEIAELNDRLELGKEFEKLHKENESLIQKKEQLDKLSDEVDKLSNLIDVVKKVSLQPMEEVLEAINIITNTALEELYDSPIQVVLSVYKESTSSKSQPVQKMSVNLQIYYGEDSYPNINNLSGGEADRVSLALTLALSKLHHSPMLIFDECMASLNCDYREKCLKVIRDITQDPTNIGSCKTVFDICHESVEGYHDSVVSVTK